MKNINMNHEIPYFNLYLIKTIFQNYNQFRSNLVRGVLSSYLVKTELEYWVSAQNLISNKQSEIRGRYVFVFSDSLSIIPIFVILKLRSGSVNMTFVPHSLTVCLIQAICNKGNNQKNLWIKVRFKYSLRYLKEIFLILILIF